MSFYLLKSTFHTEQQGHLLIDLEKVECLKFKKESIQDRENPAYYMKINMASGDCWHASYNTLEELKTVVKEILGDKIDDASVEALEVF